MKKIILGILVLSSMLFADKATLVDVISENILKVEHNGETYNIHLSGIDLFSKANHATRSVDLDVKERMKEKTLAYIEDKLKVGNEIKYYVLYEDNGVKKVWLDDHELNYKLVRDGYAIVDQDDPYLPTTFKMRMTIAMKYAKDKKFGLWGEKGDPMLAMIDREIYMCGWKNKTMMTGMTKLSVLEELQNALPGTSHLQNKQYLALKSSK